MDILYPLKWIYSWGIYRNAIVIGGSAALALSFELIRRRLFKENKPQNNLLTQLKAMYHKSLEKSNLYVDLPRLAPKVYLHLPNKTILEPIEDPLKALLRLFTIILQETKVCILF